MLSQQNKVAFSLIYLTHLQLDVNIVSFSLFQFTEVENIQQVNSTFVTL